MGCGRQPGRRGRDNQDAEDDNQDADKDMDDNNQDASKDMTVENDESIAVSSVMNVMLDAQTTVKPAAGAGAAGATGLDVVLYDSLKVEGLIVGVVTAKKRNIIESSSTLRSARSSTIMTINPRRSMSSMSRHLLECFRCVECLLGFLV